MPACGAVAEPVSPPRRPPVLAREVRACGVPLAAPPRAGVSALSFRVPSRVAPRGLAPAALPRAIRPLSALLAPARAALGFAAAFAARRAFCAAEVAVFAREAPLLPVAAAACLGGAFRAAPGFGPDALPLVAFAPADEVRRAFVAALVPVDFRPEALPVRARDAAGLAAAVRALARPWPAVPWPPALVATAAPRRFGAAASLLACLAGVAATRALPVPALAAVLPRAAAPAGIPAPFRVPGAARLLGLFVSSVGVFAIGSPHLVADAVPDSPWLLRERRQFRAQLAPGPCCPDPMNAATEPMSHHPSEAVRRACAAGCPSAPRNPLGTPRQGSHSEHAGPAGKRTGG
jgi:hypothetical protein